MKLLKKNIHIPIILLFLVLSFVFISPAPIKQRSQFHSLQLTKKTEKNGDIIGFKSTDNDKDLMIISDNGIIIRMDVNSISEMGRVTKGVKLIKRVKL